eukprot:XP_001700124.1 predicted protein [Chlamydomonas reinhardtii]
MLLNGRTELCMSAAGKSATADTFTRQEYRDELRWVTGIRFRSEERADADGFGVWWHAPLTFPQFGAAHPPGEPDSVREGMSRAFIDWATQLYECMARDLHPAGAIRDCDWLGNLSVCGGLVGAD